MIITAVIPIRSGSQRVKDKNLRPFADTSLMEHKIESLLKVPELTSIIVNTNSEEAISIVKKRYGGGRKSPTIAGKSTMLHLNAPAASSLNI